VAPAQVEHILRSPWPQDEAGRAEGGAADPLSPARNSMLRHSIVSRMSITSFQASEPIAFFQLGIYLCRIAETELEVCRKHAAQPAISVQMIPASVN